MSISEQMERLAALLAGPLYVRMKPYATSVCGLQLLAYAALRYDRVPGSLLAGLLAGLPASCAASLSACVWRAFKLFNRH
jgi:hypothetical protein